MTRLSMFRNVLMILHLITGGSDHPKQAPPTTAPCAHLSSPRCHSYPHSVTVGLILIQGEGRAYPCHNESSASCSPFACHYMHRGR